MSIEFVCPVAGRGVKVSQFPRNDLCDLRANF